MESNGFGRQVNGGNRLVNPDNRTGPAAWVYQTGLSERSPGIAFGCRGMVFDITSIKRGHWGGFFTSTTPKNLISIYPHFCWASKVTPPLLSSRFLWGAIKLICSRRFFSFHSSYLSFFTFFSAVFARKFGCVLQHIFYTLDLWLFWQFFLIKKEHLSCFQGLSKRQRAQKWNRRRLLWLAQLVNTFPTVQRLDHFYNPGNDPIPFPLTDCCSVLQCCLSLSRSDKKLKQIELFTSELLFL